MDVVFRPQLIGNLGNTLEFAVNLPVDHPLSQKTQINKSEIK